MTIVLCSLNDRAALQQCPTIYSTAVGNMPYERLAIWVPDWNSMVKPYLAGKLSVEAYTERYMALVESRSDAVQRWMDSLRNNEHIALLCFCPKGKFCHRHLIADRIWYHRPDIDVRLR